MEFVDHSQHLKVCHCEECGHQICACFAICQKCQDRLNAESEDEAQRWADAREYPSDGGKYF